MLEKLKPIIKELYNIIPNNHATTEQVHRTTEVIKNDVEGKRFYSALFLDTLQNYYLDLESNSRDSSFRIKHEDAYTTLQKINSVIFDLHTADLPTSHQTVTTTLTDNTAIMASYNDPDEASAILQRNISLDKPSIKIEIQGKRIKGKPHYLYDEARNLSNRNVQ